MIHHISAQAVANILRAISQNGSIFFMGYNNTPNMMTYNETSLTVAIADIIIYEGLSFNLSQKPSFKKVLDSARTVRKRYQTPKRNLISKDLLDIFHD